jgi:uncharacterized protein (TIGR03435 family)
MRTAAPIALVAIGLSAFATRGQSPAQTAKPPAFEVTSVKINTSPGRGLGPIQHSSTMLTARGTSLWLIVRWAYGMENFRLSAPDWMQTQPFYDIVAKASKRCSRSGFT